MAIVGDAALGPWTGSFDWQTEKKRVEVPARARDARALLMTLLLSRGTPMLSMGDESGRSQAGNNNAWCQDNELSWGDWENVDQELLEFTRKLIKFRQEHPVCRRTRFFEGTGEQLPDVWWMRPDGRRMTRRDWENDGARAIGDPTEIRCDLMSASSSPTIW